MDNSVLDLAYQLKDSLSKDARIMRLNSAEKAMENDNEVIALAYQKDMAVLDYNDALNHYSKDSQEVAKYQKLLAEAKLKLDSHPLVKEYNAAYKCVRELYEEINKAIFSPFKTDSCPREKN